MIKSILDYVPKSITLRPQQRDALLWLEREWKYRDVFVLSMPVATGKSIVALTLTRWINAHGQSVGIITPTRMLQDQYATEFPELPNLQGKDSYPCINKIFDSCLTAEAALGRRCAGCPFSAHKKKAVEGPVGLFNFHSYHFNKACKSNLIIDEAHNALDVICSLYSVRLWKRAVGYPEGLQTLGDVVLWMEKEIALHVKSMRRWFRERANSTTEAQKERAGQEIKQLHKIVERYRMIVSGITEDEDNFFFEHTTDFLRGKKQKLMQIRPITARKLPPLFWPKGVNKIVLLSATINPRDIYALGLAERHVGYFDCASPIVPSRRPVRVLPTAAVTYQTMAPATALLARRIDQLAQLYPNDKGLVHCTYQMASLLKPQLKGPRYMFHDKTTKTQVYNEFREHGGPQILVACGMDEGIDLAYDAGRWQCITKVMYPSLGDALIKEKQRLSQSWYLWETARTTLQQAGRICRTPDDTGDTYILDTNFTKLFHNKLTEHMWPSWFKEALVWQNR